MKYLSKNHDLVINAQGGFIALERIGFQSELSVERMIKKAENSKRIKKWVAENCCQECKRKHAFCVCEKGEDAMGKTAVKKAVGKIRKGDAVVYRLVDLDSKRKRK